MKKFILIGGVVSTLFVAGCTAGIVSSGAGSAETMLSPTKGNTAAGTVVFSEAGNKLRVVAEITGLSPGPHGFHIHEKGDCSAPDGTSAGGHYNPTGKPHGNPEHAEHHAVDEGAGRQRLPQQEAAPHAGGREDGRRRAQRRAPVAHE